MVYFSVVMYSFTSETFQVEIYDGIHTQYQSSQYQYKIRKTSDENQEKYQLGDY